MQYFEPVKQRLDDLGVSYLINPKAPDGTKRVHLKMDEIAAGKLWLAGKPEKYTPRSGCIFFTGDKDEAGNGENFYGEDIKDWREAVQGERINMKGFNEAKQNSKALLYKLQDKLIQIKPMRKRRMSEYDGEFCYDRRYEMTPFNGTYMTNQGMGRNMVINADFSISCMNSAKDIATYGAFIYGIIASLEENGITCEVNIGSTTYPSPTGGTGVIPFQTVAIDICVKKAGQYISEERLARSFSTSQYRRNIFSAYVYATALHGWTIDSGLGRPTIDAKRPLSSPGELNFYPDDPQKLAPEKVLEAVEKALGI